MNTLSRSPFDFRHLTNYVNTPTPPAKPKDTLPAKPKEPIRIDVILHESIRRNTLSDKRMEHNFKVAKTEIENITGRKVEINIDHTSKLRAFQYNYKGNVHSDLEDRITRLEDAQKKIGTKNSNYLHKYLFVTPNGVNGRLGFGATEMKVGVASLSDNRGISHAIGHMLGATPEDGAVTYNGWWNDTIMNLDSGSPLRGNDFRYSDKNRENIRNYLKKFA